MWARRAMISWAWELHPVIIRLQDRLDALYTDAVLRQDKITTAEELQKCLEDQTRYTRGIEICSQYLYNEIYVDIFCDKMLEADLELYLSSYVKPIYNYDL